MNETNQLATQTDINWLRWIATINLAISLATLATVLEAVWKLLP